MPMRCDAQVFFSYAADFSVLTDYVARKSREGFKVTFMHILIAGYIRAVSQTPELNRFIMNKQLYNRTELTVALTLLTHDKKGNEVENVIKVKFDPSDTIYDVAARMDEAIEKGRSEEDAGFAIKLAGFLMKVPMLPNLVVGLVKLLDRYGLAPKILLDELPFHTTMFITNVASIGLDTVFHHIYNFGNTGTFFAMGNSQRSYTVDAKGNPKRVCKLPIGVVVDERVCGGSYYSRLAATVKHALAHPEELEKEPEQVFYNEGAEYHVPKPANAFKPATAEEKA